MSLLRLLPLFALAALPAHALELGIPIQCDIGKDCFIQNYVDAKAGPDYQDYHCGHLSYPAHKGTDFRLPTLTEMRKGVNVIAAADGTVRNIRDGMEDEFSNKIDPDSIKDRECGNAVAIRHEDGWETMYCHLKKGSITVKPGDTVKRGQVLGKVGLSGDTVFPHVHLQVSQNGRIIDPFTSGDMETACNAQGETLWDKETEKRLYYRATGLIAAGWSPEVIDLNRVVEGDVVPETLPDSAAALVFWVQSYGLKAGDRVHLTLRGPDSAVLADDTTTVDRNKAVFSRMIGKKNRSQLPSGFYKGEYEVLRGGGRILHYEDKKEVVSTN